MIIVPDRVKEPPCEDDEQEAATRRERAAEAAVDVSWIFSESQKIDYVCDCCFVPLVP